MKLKKIIRASLKIMLIVVVVIALFCAVITWFAHAPDRIQTSPDREPTAKEQLYIDEANRMICQTDSVLCKYVKSNKIEYAVIHDIPLDIRIAAHVIEVFYKYGHTVPLEQEKRLIRIPDKLFEFSYSGVLYILNHELNHAAHSNLELYNYNISYEACLDHNKVRQLTINNSKKLDSMVKNLPDDSALKPNDLPSSYAETDKSALKQNDCSKKNKESEIIANPETKGCLKAILDLIFP